MGTKKEHYSGGVLLSPGNRGIIGAEMLNGRVRDGIGCSHFARTTKIILFFTLLSKNFASQNFNFFRRKKFTQQGES